MWRWKVCLCLLIFYGHTSSQPVTNDSENGRKARQLDFGECCPCPSAAQAEQGFGARESSMDTGSGSFARTRDLDDCPCRIRHADSEGASSIFSPTSMRSDGSVVRPFDKKEEFKPLLHPEVDLASSVLQTLREATDEEYQDALARDAARSMAKAADEAIFGDAVPEASGNIVTIIVNPKQTDSLDDVIPLESHIQESRCIHAPLESVSANSLGKMRMAPKSPNLLRDIFGLPRISKPAGLSHRNLLDMDNGASNIQEHVVHIDDNQVTNKSIQGLRKYAPLMKLDTDLKNKSKNIKSNVEIDSSVNKMPDFNLKNKLKELLSNRPSLEGESKINYFPLIPKMRINNTLAKTKERNNEDLSLSPSNIQELAKEKIFQTKSHLDNILQKSRPLSLRNLLKLKDVEFVPLKDLIPKAAERPTFVLPDLFNKGDVEADQKPMFAKTTEIIEKIPKIINNEIRDPDVSPSNIIEHISENNCHSDVNKKIDTNVGDPDESIPSTEIFDIASSPSDIQSTDSDAQSNKLADNTEDCIIKPLPDTETNFPQTMKSSLEDKEQDNNEGELKLDIERLPDNVEGKEDPESKHVLSDEDCVKNNNDLDSMTDSSNNINSVINPNNIIRENLDDSLENKSMVIQESCSQELLENDYADNFDSNPENKLINPLSLHKTLSSIKENVLKHLENLRNPNTDSLKLKNIDRTPSEKIGKDKEARKTKENLVSDCQNEESIQLTTIKPDICNEDLDSNNEPSNNVSMQDLQKISDEMLQQEQERESKTLECSEPEVTEEVSDTKIPLEISSRENESIHSEQSADTQNGIMMDEQNIIDDGNNNGNNIENTCQSDLLPKPTEAPDANAEASDNVFKSATQNNDIMSSPHLLREVLQPDVPDGIEIAPIPTLDEIKLSLTKMFDKTAKSAEEYSASEAASMTDTSNILKPIMATDASTTNFQLSSPPLRLEDMNFDILQLKQPPSLIPKIPKIDLHSYKTKLPLPIDLGLKPSKLQSALEDITVGRKKLRPSDLSRKNTKSNTLWESVPNLDNFGTRAKTNTQKVAKSLRKPDTLRSSLFPNQGLEDLSDNIHSHAKNTLRSMQHTLQSRFREASKTPIKLQTNDLLDAISRNHEDVNDKLKALHIDFNDRIETMRNNLYDKSIFGSSESRSTKSNKKSFSAFSNLNKDKQVSLKTSQPKLLTNRRESKKTLKPRKHEQPRSIGIGSSQRLPTETKFKMPAAASVPVPRTIKVPELKAAQTKSPGLATQRTSSVIPNIHNIDALKAKESSDTLWKTGRQKLHSGNKLRNSINPFKDSKIKVSFSTTPRPTIPPRLQSRTFLKPSSHTNLGKNHGKFGQRQDHNGSPSEMTHSIITPSISSNLDQHDLANYGMDSQNRQGSTLYELPRKLEGRENLEENAEPSLSKDLQSWPSVSESAFLSKVKEAVKARMSKVNSPAIFKQSDAQSVSRKFSEDGKGFNSNTDMSRSASNKLDIIEGQSLKENVSYKCTMVCTKE